MQKAKKSKKYAPIVAAGRKLFWKYGIRKVSVEEISKEAGVSKMTFYRLFENKSELVKVILEEEYRVNWKRYEDLMNSDQSFPQKIEKLIEMKMEGTSEISEEMIRDIFTMDDPLLKGVIEQQRTAGMTRLMQDFREAQQKGGLREEIKPEFFLAMQGKIFEMLMDEQVRAMFPSQKEAIGYLTRFFFYGLSGQPDER